ncbi:MAG: acyl carrier protein [Rhodospirillales bacterium]|jgi:acyl carrier protein|nr:acyl carrier protein [Rhodospirillales bacterium]
MIDQDMELRRAIGESLHQEVFHLPMDQTLENALGMNSLAGLELMAEMEDRFGVRFRDEDLARPRTLGNILAALQSRPGRAVQ